VESGYIDPRFLDLGTSCRWALSFTSCPLYRRGTHWIGGWVGPRAGLDDVEKIKLLTLPGLELRPLGRPARCQSLYRLSCLGSTHVRFNVLISGKLRYLATLWSSRYRISQFLLHMLLSSCNASKLLLILRAVFLLFSLTRFNA
jgi:hypothetical protein